MNTREACVQRLETELKECNAQIIDLRAKVREVDPLKRVELEQRLGGLRQERDMLAWRLRQVRFVETSGWQDFKKAMEIAWGELGQALDKKSGT